MKISREDLQKFGGLEILAKQVVEGFITGMHKSPFHGFSVEFAEHRLYNPGESTRHIDWKLFGRTDKLFIKKYEEETNLRCKILIDTSSSMYFPIESLSKIEFSVYAAACIMYLLQSQRDAFGLSLFDEELYLDTAIRSSGTHFNQMLIELEKILNQKNQNKKTDITRVINEIAEKTPRRSLVIIFSDLIETLKSGDDFFDSLKHLKFNKHDIVLFLVNDKKHELEFDFGNQPYEFVDSESGEKIKLRPNDIRENYLDSINQYRNEIKMKCTQYKIELIEADIEGDFGQVLLPFLLKRSKLY